MVLEQLVKHDITGPKIPDTILHMDWNDSFQPGRLNAQETPEIFASRFQELDPTMMCKNYSSNSLQRALDTFASVTNKDTHTLAHLDDVGFLTQESFQDDTSILPSFQIDSEAMMQHSQELLGIEDPLSDEERDGGNIFFGNDVDSLLVDGQPKDPALALIDDIERETRKLKSLLRAGNYETGMFDGVGLLKAIRDAQFTIKAKMRAKMNPNKEDKWVSCCPQRSKKTKCFYASKNC